MDKNYHIRIKDRELSLNHLRGFEVKYLQPTDTRGSRVSIYDTRHQVRKIISYDYRIGNTRDTAIDYLVNDCGITIDSFTSNDKNDRVVGTLLTKDFKTQIKKGKKQ